MNIKWFFRNIIKRNLEKWVFFTLFLVSCGLIIVLILNLPSFKVSLYEQKITRRTTASTIQRVDVTPFIKLKEVLAKPLNYSKLFSRDTFSPLIERIACPKCGNQVAKNLDVCPSCGYEFDADQDGMPNQWEKRYGLNPFNADDAYLDKDEDGFSNIDECTQGTNPNDPASKPEEINPLGNYRLKRIYKKPLQLLFEGYMLLPDGTYSFVINSEDTSHFMKLGETITGYKIVDFKKESRNRTRMGVEVSEDVSKLSLLSEKGEKIVLTYHNITTEKELWAQIENTDTREIMELRMGDKFGEFEIKTITENGLEIVDDQTNTYTLKYERRLE